MLKIRGTTITLTRGDSLRLKVNIQDKAGNPYQPSQGDTILFALKKNNSDETPLISKIIPTDTMELYLAPEDTKKLVQPNSYVYDISLTYGATGDVDTFIAKATFNISEEVG